MNKNITDLFGTTIEVGKYVLASNGASVIVCVVTDTGISNNMIRIKELNGNSPHGLLRYASEISVVDDEKATYYLLKNLKERSSENSHT